MGPHVFWARVRSYFQNRRDEARLSEELQSHLDMLAEEYVSQGMSPGEARIKARRAMGGIEQMKEAHRDERRFAPLSTLWQDLRYAARQLRNSPGFSALTIATLAIGIGVNAAMFTVIDQTLFRQLPYPDASRLVIIKADRQMTSSVAYTDVKAWQKRDRDFLQLAYYFGDVVTLDEHTSSELISKTDVSANFFSTLGVKPHLGRTFTTAEQQPGRNNVLILSNTVWRNRFHGDRSVLGKKLRVGGQIYTVVGVMPPGFTFPQSGNDANEVWTPYPLQWNTFLPNSWTLQAAGRLKPEVSVTQAMQNLNSLQQNLHREDSKNHDFAKLDVALYRDALTRSIRPALLALEVVVAMVWLIACVNVAGLMLTRIQGRRRELSIRAALGAGRQRLISQLLTESLSLSTLAGLVGFFLSQITTLLLGHAVQGYLPAPVGLHLSWRLFAMLLGGVLISALLIGVLPVIHAGSRRSEEGLRASSPRIGISRSQIRIRDCFVVAQVGLSFVLLLSAGLMLQTVYSLRHLPLGFTTEHVIDTSIFLPPHQYDKKNVVTGLYQPLLDQLQHLPGVREAALSSVLPVQLDFGSNASFSLVGGPQPEPGHEPQADLRLISPNLQKLLHIRLLRGRLLAETDGPETAAVAVVNSAFVRTYLHRQDPLGKEIHLSDGRFAKTVIVGVVDDVHQKALTAASSPEIDIPLAQIDPEQELYSLASMFMQVAISTDGDPQSVTSQVRSIVHKINPDLALTAFTTLQQNVDDSFGSQTLAGHLLSLFAGIALLIAAAGLYALLAYSVNQRTHEIGVRVALGAQRNQVFQMVLRHAAFLVVLGLVLGGTAAWFSARILQSFLYGVSGHDALTMGAVAAVLLSVCLLASFLPARRAASVDPMIALRHE
jgi:predicted permease